MNVNIKSANDLRSLFLKFFQQKNHAVIPSASPILKRPHGAVHHRRNAPAGPHLLGAKHPMGTRSDVQKCIRTGDIDDVGDPSHLTSLRCWATGRWAITSRRKPSPGAGSSLTSPEWLGIDK